MRALFRLHRRIASVVALLTIVACTGNPPTGARYVTYLIDTSGSFLPLQRADLEALKSVSGAIIQRIVTDSEPPISFYWAPITDFSTDAPGPCGGLIEYDPALLQRGDQHYNTKKRLETWHKACIDHRLNSNSLRRANYTDISGALRAIAEATQNITGKKLTVILSDFVEDLPPDRRAIDYTLKDHSIIMLYRHGSQLSRDEHIYARLEAFETALHVAGASSICRASVRGFTPAAVKHCI